MSDPYHIAGPALVSFSGGRTSGYMLHEILRAHGGKLPENVHVCFANTGREREETLRFVHECGSRWGVRVRWLELRADSPWFEEVGFNSASRNGEPFDVAIAKKQQLPSPARRFCTTELKIKPMERFARSLDWPAETWVNVVGLRYDEGHRVMKAFARNDADDARFQSVMPLAKAKVTKASVMTFWEQQPFDLGLQSYEGNCDLCILKSPAKRVALIRERPASAIWWIEKEREYGATFTGRESYAELAQAARNQGHLFDGIADADEFDAECGLHCSV